MGKRGRVDSMWTRKLRSSSLPYHFLSSASCPKQPSSEQPIPQEKSCHLTTVHLNVHVSLMQIPSNPDRRPITISVDPHQLITTSLKNQLTLLLF